MFKKILKKLFNRCSNNSLFQDWVVLLPCLTKQSSLISAIRGTDIKNGECEESKKITRMLRYIIVYDVKKKNKHYMSSIVLQQNKVIKFLIKIYPYNKHWVEHICGAAFIIKQYHPNKYIAEYWGSIGSIVSYKIRDYNRKEKIRIEKEELVKHILEKYTDIYTERYV